MGKVDIEALFAQSDILQLLQSLTDASKGTVGPELLALIKDGSVLVNAGRAHLTREDALLAELRTGRFTGIFDVHHTEPLPLDSPLRQLTNVIMTPHCAGREGRTRYASLMLEELARLLEGQPLLYEVDPARAKAMTDPRLTRG